MKASIHYFGLIADKTGKSSELIDFDEPTGTSVNLRLMFEKRFPSLSGSNYKIAVNQTISDELIIIDSHIEIALLPPFAGG